MCDYVEAVRSRVADGCSGHNVGPLSVKGFLAQCPKSKLKIDDAPGFIKCALGENVKQSNWGDRNVVRFPQTRMGVEQVFYDAFYRAKKYRQDQLQGVYRSVS